MLTVVWRLALDARLGSTLESERRNHEAELLAERDRHEQAVNAERQRAHESVEREIAAGERQYLMRQTDEIRQAAKANEAVLKEQLQEAKAFALSLIHI